MTLERPDVVAVGLTGGIGAGKTTALRFFAEEGALTLSADEIVHRLYSDRAVKEELARYFGPEVFDTQGEVDRRRLAEAVRGRADRLAWLEALTHPLVVREMTRFIDQAPPGSVVVCEVPLLFEAKMESHFDLVITIEAGADYRRSRSVHEFDLEMFGEFEALQASSRQRVEQSHLAFFNDDDVEHLRAFVRGACERARSMAREG